MKTLFLISNIIALIVFVLFFSYQYYISILTTNLASYANCSKNKKQIEINKLRNIAYDFYKNYHNTLKSIGQAMTLLSWLIVLLMIIHFYIEIKIDKTDWKNIDVFQYVLLFIFIMIAIIASILSAYNYKKLSADFVKYQNYLLHITYKITEEYRKEKDTIKNKSLLFKNNETYPIQRLERWFLIPSNGFTLNNPYDISVSDTNRYTFFVKDNNNNIKEVKEVINEYKYELSLNNSRLIFEKQHGGYYKLSQIKFNQSYDYTKNIELVEFDVSERLFREKNNSSKEYQISENSVVDHDNIYKVEDTSEYVIKVDQITVNDKNITQIGTHNPKYIFIDTNTNIKYSFMITSDKNNLRLIDVVALDNKYSGNLEKKIKSHISNAHPYEDTEYIYRTEVILDKDMFT